MHKCNQRPIILGPFHRLNCNSGLECENHDDYPNILQDITDEELQEFIIRMESIHDNLVKEPLENIETNSNCYLSNINLNELGNRARKHLEQIGSIINQLFQLNLLQSNTCFIEMGAGRGQLSHELHACLKQDSTVNFVLIERDHQRYRYDAHHRLEHQGPSFERYRLDIRDLYLSELPSIKNSQNQIHSVIISKHLCGGATDLALRCGVNAQRETKNVQGIIIALCCHHRLMWNDYVGKDFFYRNNLTPKDFSLIRTLTSWCTNENRHRISQEGKRSTIGMKIFIYFYINLIDFVSRWYFISIDLFNTNTNRSINLF
jgi:tRNA:m4X modification enzyme